MKSLLMSIIIVLSVVGLCANDKSLLCDLGAVLSVDSSNGVTRKEIQACLDKRIKKGDSYHTVVRALYDMVDYTKIKDRGPVGISLYKNKIKLSLTHTWTDMFETYSITFRFKDGLYENAIDDYSSGGPAVVSRAEPIGSN